MEYLNIKKNNSALSFDVELIGPVIAKLISYKEKAKYDFYVAKYKANIYLSEDETEYDFISNVFNAYLINKSSNVFNSYEETYLNDDNINILSEDPNIIVLKLEHNGVFKDKDDYQKVSFYNNLINKNTMANLNKYSYVYDFINYITNYINESDKTNLDDKKLDELLDEYINKNKSMKKIKKSI